MVNKLAAVFTLHTSLHTRTHVCGVGRKIGSIVLTSPRCAFMPASIQRSLAQQGRTGNITFIKPRAASRSLHVACNHPLRAVATAWHAETRPLYAQTSPSLPLASSHGRRSCFLTSSAFSLLKACNLCMPHLKDEEKRPLISEEGRKQ